MGLVEVKVVEVEVVEVKEVLVEVEKNEQTNTACYKIVFVVLVAVVVAVAVVVVVVASVVVAIIMFFERLNPHLFSKRTIFAFHFLWKQVLL